jgi:hypothetical protein
LYAKEEKNNFGNISLVFADKSQAEFLIIFMRKRSLLSDIIACSFYDTVG